MPRNGGEVAPPVQQPSGDARRSAGTRSDFAGALGVQIESEYARSPLDDRLQFVRLIEIEPKRNTEPVAQRRRDQARAGRCADEREGRKGDLDRASAWTFADHQIEFEILHRGIQDLLDRRIEPVNLVNEQHITRLEIGENRGEVSGAHKYGAG